MLATEAAVKGDVDVAPLNVPVHVVDVALKVAVSAGGSELALDDFGTNEGVAFQIEAFHWT